MDNNWYRHAMTLVGYKVIEAGDTIQYTPRQAVTQTITIDDDSEYIGQTMWILKNSYGTDQHHHGYLYAVLEDMSFFSNCYHIKFPIMSSIYNHTDSIICEDKDGDGYYFWGLGPKPTHCPACAPNEPDGDDSNPEIGPIDTYGFYQTYEDPADTIIISSNATISTTWTICDHIFIANNAILTISSEGIINLSGHNKIIVDSGTLIIDGGIINKARIEVRNGGNLFIQNDGNINLGTLGYLDIEGGGEFNHIEGEITQ